MVAVSVPHHLLAAAKEPGDFPGADAVSQHPRRTGVSQDVQGSVGSELR